MQTDIWLTEEITYSERCPICSQPLKNGLTTCFSCGFSTESPTGTSVWIDPAVYEFPHTSSRRKPHQVSQEKKWQSARELTQARRHPNPNTPIPQRASAQPSNATPGSIVNPQKRQSDVTSSVEKQRKAQYRGTPEIVSQSSVLQHVQKNSSVWEYETPASQTSISLPPHALSICEEPTRPELAAQAKVTQRLHSIDEITTVPPQSRETSISTSRSIIPVDAQLEMITIHRPDQHSTQIELSQDIYSSSWTSGKATSSSQARLISSRKRRKSSHLAVSLNPIDRLRWWLLRPGRIEFVLWLGGTILLVAVTCVLLFVTAFSFEWITPGIINPATTNTSAASTGSEQQSTTVATSKLVLTLIDKGPILPGQSIDLRGQGFSPLGHIRFLFDGTLQLFDQNGQSLTQANAHGVFVTTLVLDNNLPWHSGPHFINAQDITSRRTAKLPITLSPAPIGKGTPNTPVPSYPPNVTPPVQTPIPIVPGGQPTPVGQTPVPVTPTPHPVTPTPTVGTTPITTPTVGTTPTAVPSVGTTPGVTTTVSTATGSGLGNALDNTGDAYLSKQLTHLNPWVWLMIACYCLSMTLLGIAGVLHKRNQ